MYSKERRIYARCIQRLFALKAKNLTTQAHEHKIKNTQAPFALKGSQAGVHKQTRRQINTHKHTYPHKAMHLSEAGLCLSKTIMGRNEC